MSEPSIRDLLLTLDDDIAVDPEFDQRLRARLDGELRVRPTTSASAIGGPSESDERIELTVVETTQQSPLGRRRTPDRRRRSLLLVAAAGLVDIDAHVESVRVVCARERDVKEAERRRTL